MAEYLQYLLKMHIYPSLYRITQQTLGGQSKIGATELGVPGVHVYPLFFVKEGTNFTLDFSSLHGSLKLCTPNFDTLPRP